MKVRELIEALQKLDPELEVYSSVDDEGNWYRQLNCEPEEGCINPADLCGSGTDTFYFDSWSDEECLLEPGERDDFDRAVCL